MGEGFTWETQDRARDIAAARAAWDAAKTMIADPRYHLVLLDELNIVLRYDYLPIAEVVTALQGEAARPPRRRHRPQRQAGAHRDRRPGHRDDAGEASLPQRRQGAEGASSSEGGAYEGSPCRHHRRSISGHGLARGCRRPGAAAEARRRGARRGRAAESRSEARRTSARPRPQIARRDDHSRAGEGGVDLRRPGWHRRAADAGRQGPVERSLLL